MAGEAGLRVAQRCRVILDNDWSGDPDGLVALAHHLLSPANRVVAVTSTYLDPAFESPVSRAEDGAALARELIALVGDPEPPPAHAGCERPLAPGVDCEASGAIIVEARRDDPLPLFLVCGGPLTNVAVALQQAPDIATRLTLVWVGGSLDPAAFEYNRDTDPGAAAYVLSRPGLTVRQFPLECYRRCAYSVAELEHDLAGSGLLGRWLWTRFTSLHLPDFVRVGGVWPLGDSPPVLVTALDEESSTFAVVGRTRVFSDVDFRLIVGDMLAKLRMHEQRRPRT